MSDQETSTTEGTEQAAEATEQESDESQQGADSQEETEADSDWRNDFDPDKARDKIRKLNSEAKGLRERAKTAEEKAASADKKDEQISALEATTLRYEVAFDLGLPKELVPRLHGSTKEELIEDAEKLLDLVSPAKRPATKRPAESLRGGGEPEREPEETDTRKIAERMFRH